MFSKVSHVGWIAVLTLAVVVAAFAVSRRTRETVVFSDGTVAEITPSVTSVTVSPESGSVQKGGTRRFAAAVEATGGASTEVTWSVTGRTSAGTGISTSGLLTVAPGETAIALTLMAVSTFDNTKKGTAAVTVTVTGAATVSVTSVSLEKPALTLTVGASETFTATVFPTNVTEKGVTWKSDKPGVATVDAAGKITAVKAGTAIITVTTRDGGKTARCAVTVMGESITAAPELVVPGLKVYPNPFASTVHLTAAEDCTLRVINTAGTTVYTQNIENPDETIRLEHLPAGMYFLRIEKDGKAMTFWYFLYRL